MAIQMRRGEVGNLDRTKLLPGEWAICTDGTIVICYASGKTVDVVTKNNIDRHVLKIENSGNDVYTVYYSDNSTEKLTIKSGVEVDNTLTISGKAADSKAVGDRLSQLSKDKVNIPKDETGSVLNGTSGQILQTNGDGTTKWVDNPSGVSGSGASTSIVDVQINGTSILNAGVANIPAGNSSKYGVFLENYNAGLKSTDRGGSRAITGSVLDSAVKLAMTDGKGAAWTDMEKAGAWSRLSSIKTAMDEVAVAGATYFLNELTEVSITLPDDALAGQEITVVWYNVETPATLSITGNMLDFDYTPSANTRSEISALYDGKFWSIIGMSQDVATE